MSTQNNLEIEKKWIIPSENLHIDFFDNKPTTRSKIYQGYLPVPTTFNPDNMTLSIKRNTIPLTLDAQNAIIENILDNRGKIRDDILFRFRELTTGGYNWDGPKKVKAEITKIIFTIKCTPRGSDANSIARTEIEWELPTDEIDIEKFKLLITRPAIQKTRIVMQDQHFVSNGNLEFDFYQQPRLNFVSVEREFSSETEMKHYNLPVFIRALGAIDVSEQKYFYNTNLAKTEMPAILTASRLFQQRAEQIRLQNKKTKKR
jgi:hypothetical protein